METLKDSVSKCHIKCINIDGNKYDNIEVISNNFTYYESRARSGWVVYNTKLKF
jgi:hypothetical protein